MQTTKTVMIVDDDREFVTMLRVLLDSGGYAVQYAYTGEELFKHLKNEKPDLILLDIMMPELDGLTVLRRLKAAPETSSIPVMLLTARDGYKDVLAGYKYGSDYYMSKPFTNDQLLSGIDLLLGESASQTLGGEQ